MVGIPVRTRYVRRPLNLIVAGAVLLVFPTASIAQPAPQMLEGVWAITSIPATVRLERCLGRQFARC
jgi:hypothetical protein